MIKIIKWIAFVDGLKWHVGIHEGVWAKGCAGGEGRKRYYPKKS